MGREKRAPEHLQGHQISSETISAHRKPCKIDLSRIRYLGSPGLFYH
jgi:hypothetical protein